MFASDKELKNNKKIIKSSRTSNAATITNNSNSVTSSNTSTATSDIIEITKLRREEREHQRELGKVSILIQTWWRCHHHRKQWLYSLSHELTNKCRDINKLNTMLKTTICPDAPICLHLTRLIVFTQYIDLLPTYCQIILSPSLLYMDSSKNLSMYLSPYLAHKIIKIILDYFNKLPKFTKELDTVAIVCINCLPLIIGAGESYKLHYPEQIMNNFTLIRKHIDNINIMGDIAVSFYRKLDPYLLNSSTTEEETQLLIIRRNNRSTLCLDALFSFCDVFIYTESDPAVRERRLLRFVQSILSTPLMTLSLSTNAIQSFVASRTFSATLLHCETHFSRLNLDASLLPAFNSSLWLLGNLASFAQAIIYQTSDESKQDKLDLNHNTEKSHQELQQYISLCSNFLSAIYIPGLLYGKRGVVWTENGNASTAAAVPAGLYSQISSLYDPKFLNALSIELLSTIDIRSNSIRGKEDDIKAINDALAASSAQLTSQAVKEVASERSWYSGKWAVKLLKNFSTSLGLSIRKDSSLLPSIASPASSTSKESKVNQSELFAFCSFASLILTPAALSNYSTDNWKGLSSFVFSNENLPMVLWVALIQLNIEAFTTSFNPSRDLHPHGLYGVIATLATILRMRLIVCDDRELYEEEKPLPLHQVYVLIKCFKSLLFSIIQHDNDLLLQQPGAANSSTRASYSIDYSIYAFQTSKVISLVLNDLYTRWARKPFSPPSLFEIKEANSSTFRAQMRIKTPFTRAITLIMPWSIEFFERLTFFREILSADRIAMQGPDHMRSTEDVVVLRIRRKCILEDGMRALEKNGVNIKKRIVIKYIDEFNQEEMGIDSGGLFKDFWTDLSGQVFNSSYGLFATTSTRHLYPSSASLNLYNERDIEKMFYFLGLVLGKAIFENITVQPQFAHFFLSFMHGKYDFTGLVNDLISYDVDLYKNLMFLKVYEGEIEDLSLTFSVADNSLGSSKEIDLIPGGSNISVDSLNRHRYINAMAKYYLHDRIKMQAKSFFKGLHQVIDQSLFHLFCAPELQYLISGGSNAIDIADLQKNASYAAGYSSFDRNINRFWAVVQEMNQDDLALLIRFVTSCDRPPSLGFADLHPPFTVQRVDSERDSRLPTSSTCFNVLKLPVYSSQNVLKEKLLFAIRSRSGFDLS